MPAVFDQHYVKRLTAQRSKTGKNKCDLANQIRNDIAEFKTKTDRQDMIWCGSTEIFLEQTPLHQTPAAPEKRPAPPAPNTPPPHLHPPAAPPPAAPPADPPRNPPSHT